jgi:hypothetical protein
MKASSSSLSTGDCPEASPDVVNALPPQFCDVVKEGIQDYISDEEGQ